MQPAKICGHSGQKWLTTICVVICIYSSAKKILARKARGRNRFLNILDSSFLYKSTVCIIGMLVYVFEQE